MNNPFYVQPAQAPNIGGALQGFAQNAMQSRKQNFAEQQYADQQEQALKNEQIQVQNAVAAQEKQQRIAQLAQEAYESGDPAKVIELMQLNPDMGKEVQSQLDYQNESQQNESQKAIQSIFAATQSGNFELAADLANDRAVLAERMGLDNTQISELAADLKNPDTQKQAQADAMAMMVPFLTPEQQLKYSQGQDQTGKYSNVKTLESGKLSGLNKFTNKYEVIETPEGETIAPKAPLVTVNTGDKANEAGAIERAKQNVRFDVDNYKAINTAGTSAKKLSRNLKIAQQLGERAFSGSTADIELNAKKFAEAMGFDLPEGVASSEALQAMITNLTLDQTSRLSGAISEKEIDLIGKLSGQLTQTKEGRRLNWALQQELADQEVRVSNAARKFRKDNSNKFVSDDFDEYKAAEFGNYRPLYEISKDPKNNKMISDINREQYPAAPNLGFSDTDDETGELLYYKGGDPYDTENWGEK